MRRDTGGQLVRLIQLANQDYLAARVLQHIGDLFWRLQRIQRHADQPGVLDRQVADKPFGAVLRQQRNALARHAAQRQQRAGQAARLLVDLAPGEVMPHAIDRLTQPDGIGLPIQPVVEALQRQLQWFGHRGAPVVGCCAGPAVDPGTAPGVYRSVGHYRPNTRRALPYRNCASTSAARPSSLTWAMQRLRDSWGKLLPNSTLCAP